MKRPLVLAASVVMTVSLAPAGAYAAGNPSGSGQPNQSCQTVEGSGGTTPGSSSPNGGASMSPGSPFNEPGINSTNGGTGGAAYSAGNANSPNPKAVSQYDVACYQVSSH